MKTLKTLVVTAAAFATGSAMAANIAVIAGSEQDGFFNLIKKGVDDATLVVKANDTVIRGLRSGVVQPFAGRAGALE